MYSRTWHGVVPIAYKEGFEKYEYETGVKDTKNVPGNCGSYLQVIEKGEYAHFFLCSFWESLESMRLYAGDALTKVVDYPEDEQ